MPRKKSTKVEKTPDKTAATPKAEEPTMSVEEAIQPPPKPSFTRRRWVNIGTQTLEVGHNRFLKPGESTNTRPWRLEFYTSIGAMEEVLD